MEPFYSIGTKSTPEVILDKSKETFHIKGWSKPENAIEFYEPIMNWLTEYSNNPNPCTILTFNMDYFNSSSSKILLNIIHILEDILKKGEVKVNWFYGDEDTLEAGQAYESLTKVPFTFIELLSSNSN
jgi:hypothetical protein